MKTLVWIHITRRFNLYLRYLFVSSFVGLFPKTMVTFLSNTKPCILQISNHMYKMTPTHFYYRSRTTFTTYTKPHILRHQTTYTTDTKPLLLLTPNHIYTIDTKPYMILTPNHFYYWSRITFITDTKPYILQIPYLIYNV